MSRAGTAVALPVALLALALLVPLLIARHLQGSHTRGNVARSVRSAVCGDVARAAVAEAWWVLEHGSTDSGNPLYLTLRGASATAQTLTLEVPHLAQMLAEDPQLAGYKLVDGKVKVTIGPRNPTSVRTREGIADVRIEARALHEVSGLARVVREGREMRLALTALPAPFDGASVLVLDARPLVGDQTNGWMEEAVSIIGQIANGVKSAGGSVVGEAPPPLIDDLDREIHRFPAKYVVRSSAAQIPDLTRIYLWPKIEAAHRRIEALGPASDLAGQAASDPAGTAKKAGQIAQAHSALLEEAKGYQAQFEEVGGPAAEQLMALAGQLTPQEWRRRAFFLFEGQGASQRLLDMLDGYARESPPLSVSGVAFVDNRDEPLKLKGRTFHGRLVVCATGLVDLDDVKVQDPANDLLVVQAEGVLTTHGRIDASIVVRGGVQMGADTALAGSLIVAKVSTGDQYGGKLDFDASRQRVMRDNLDRPEMFRVAFSPAATSREMTE